MVGEDSALLLVGFVVVEPVHDGRPSPVVRRDQALHQAQLHLVEHPGPSATARTGVLRERSPRGLYRATG